MITDYNYRQFFNEFNLSIDKKLYIIPIFNGYYFTKSYKKHLFDTIENFKHHLYYELPHIPMETKKEILINMHNELKYKHSQLKDNVHKRVIRNYYSINTPFVSLNIQPLNKVSKKRIIQMHRKQITILDNAIKTIEQSAEITGFSLKTKKKPCNKKSNLRWNGEKVGFIQLIKSLIKNKTILLESINETDAIKEIAKFLNTSINNNNFSSFSRAIHSNNNDYSPSIFKELTNGYNVLATERRENREMQ
jgi:hypothetical protein